MILREVAAQPGAAVQDDPRKAEQAKDAALWADFGAPSSAGSFYRSWLAIQCGFVAQATAGVLLIDEAEGQYAVAATWPEDIRDAGQLAAAAGPALKQRRGIVQYLPDNSGRHIHACVSYPFEIDSRLRAVIVVQLGIVPPAELRSVMRCLHWGAGWLETHFRRLQGQDGEARVKRMAFAMDTLSDANERRELYTCLVSIASGLAVRLGCNRVSMGIARRNRVRLTAISHSAVFEKRAALVEMIENAMEEALVQREAITLPGLPSTQRRLSLAHQELMRVTGSSSIASVVLTSGDRMVGAITLERNAGAPFDSPTMHLLEAVAHLLGPLIEMKAERQRLIGGRLADGIGSALAALTGRRRPALKVAAAAVLGVLAYSAFAQGDFRVSGKAIVEGAIQRAAVAPFDGFVTVAPARAGDIVTAGDTLARLDDRELNLELSRARSEYEQQLVKYSDAVGGRDPVAARLATALIEQSKAQLAQAEDKLQRAEVTAPFSGVVVSGDLRQRLGSPVEKGQVLFQLAPLDSFRIVLQVDERDISFVSAGQSGKLVLTGFTGRSFPFVVKSVTPVATAFEGRNFFPVEGDIQDFDKQLRPGMEGIGKISIGQRRLVWVWTRPLLDWARISIWKWVP